jgi:signal transduction histidine kinase
MAYNMRCLFRRASVSGRLLLVLLPMVALFVGGTAWLAVIGSEKIADSNATRYGQDLAESQASVIAMPVAKMKTTAEHIASTIHAYAASGGKDRGFIAALIRNGLAEQADFVAGFWFYAVPDQFGRDADYRRRDISLGDPATGRLLTYYVRAGNRAGFEAAEPDFEQQPYWRLPRFTRQPYVASPYAHAVFGQERLFGTYALPVFVNGEFIGVVGANMDVRKVGEFVDTLHPAGGSLLTVNATGVWLHNPYADLDGTPVKVGDDPQTELTLGELDAIKSLRGYVAEKVAPNGERVRRVAVPLPYYKDENRRMLLVDFPLESLLEPYKGIRVAILGGGLLAAIAIALAVFITVPVLIGNPLQALRISIEDLKYGRLGQPVAAIDRADDIGAIARTIDAFRHTLIDRGRLEREKAELQNQLLQQQKMDAIGQLAGGIAHDFNNLLGVMLGYLAFISSDSESGSSAHKYADHATRAGNRAKDMIRQLLSFARPSIGLREVIAADAVMQETAMLLRGMLPASIALDIQVPRALPTIRVDQTQMIQVLMNLCINAADAFAGRSGSIAVRAGLAPSPDWDVKSADWPSFTALTPSASAGPFVSFEVFDDAGGIATDNLGRLFEPFYTTKGPGKGTGMGLAIVYGVLQAHGGGLEVRSKQGGGTLFRLSLPFVAGLPAPVADSEPAIPKCRPCRVLIVDDEQDMADMLEEGLSRLGHEVAVCEDAMEALAVFDDNPDAFDVVLTDQTMPRIAGVELIRRLKQRRPNLPCILYTGYSDGSDHTALRASGADVLLFKPVLPAAVDAYIADALGIVRS